MTNKIAMAILVFNLFITMLGTGILIPIMPEYLGLFDAGGLVYGFLLATFSFAQFALSPVAGELSDRHGRKPFIVCGLILLGISAILFAIAKNISILFIARFLMGVGAAFVIPTIMAYAADVTTIDNRGKK
ncbi:MFS transporter [Neobacillus niacini]|uniref:MFS transporter n=1 Tax=Neobacillus niacini TaxID=86668 RepID=UPI002FFEC620